MTQAPSSRKSWLSPLRELPLDIDGFRVNVRRQLNLVLSFCILLAYSLSASLALR